MAFTLVGVLVLYGLALLVLRPPSPGRALSLDAVLRDATCSSTRTAAPAQATTAYCQTADRKIITARFLDEDARIVGASLPANAATHARPTEFWTAYPRSDTATNDLLKTFFSSDVRVTVDPQPTKALVRFLTQFLLPLVVLANLFALLFSLLGSGSDSGTEQLIAFGRVGDRRSKSGVEAPVTFADVAGAGEAVTELKEVQAYLTDRTAFAAMGARAPKGVLLVGPPGCGKTLLARALAGEANANFYSISGSEFVEALVGVGAARVRDLFAQARAHAPSLVFVDELDAMARQRGAGLGQGHDEREQTLNEMLVQMDGFSSTEGVVVLAATNRPDILDPALLRAGRFDRHVTVERPDLEGRAEILRLHARSRPLAGGDDDLAYIARHTPGFSGADLANLVNEAALLAVREGARSVSRQHLEEAVDRLLSGPRLRSLVLSDEDKQRIATHESGHAVVAAALGKTAAIQKVSIIARGRGVGHLAVLGDDRSLHTSQDMSTDIAIAMAGFAAEILVFGQVSTGSEQDLERATNTARDMAGRFGMSSRLGPVRVLSADREVFLGRDYLQASDVSQPTLVHLDAEVRRMVEEQRDEATAILIANRATLDALAAALAANETLRGADLHAALAGVHPAPVDSKSGASTYSGAGRPERS
ncbi:MAG: ATP-dependent zinc metalloprotease FtsH [Actinomycetota bacterium]|nr:ATP-dependent zinc metalloprotease FtsH [Actinomycetota bacterium]